MATKISLDTQALIFLIEKLGDDFILELKHSVINEAIKRQTKSIVDLNVKNAIAKAVIDEVEKYIGEASMYTADEVKILNTHMIKSSIQAQVRKRVLILIHEELNKIDFKSLVIELIKKYGISAIYERIKPEVINAIEKSISKEN